MITSRIVLKHSTQWLDSDMLRWKCGTCRGLYVVEPDRIMVSAIWNDCSHNGHFEIFMKRIEHYAKKNNLDLYFISFLNLRFKEYLKRRGYAETTVIIRKDGEITDGVYKRFGGIV